MNKKNKDMTKQLSLLDELIAIKKAEEPYFNCLGEPLPWETKEYLEEQLKEGEYESV